MTPEQIHDIAISEFGLEPRSRSDGWSYWTPKTAVSKTMRVLRVSHDGNGNVREVKLVPSSLAAGHDVFLHAPLTEERIRQAINLELRSARE
jgi:hypothetical protein